MSEPSPSVPYAQWKTNAPYFTLYSPATDSKSSHSLNIQNTARNDENKLKNMRKGRPDVGFILSPSGFRIGKHATFRFFLTL